MVGLVQQRFGPARNLPQPLRPLARRDSNAYNGIMTSDASSLPPPSSLDERSREIFQHIVDAYMETGAPLGSRNLSRLLTQNLSPASIRNVMSDLEHLGLIYAPHVSAGRMPTELGLRYFVDGLLEIGDLSQDERTAIEGQVKAAASGQTVDSVLREASTMLSGLTQGAGLVIASKSDVRLRHIEFVRLAPDKALVVMVGEHGVVENRVVDLPPGMSSSTLLSASNFLNAHVAGRTLADAQTSIANQMETARRELNELAQNLVDQGLATWAGATQEAAPQLIVRGRGNLISSAAAGDDLERLGKLFDELESREGVSQLLDLTEAADGVKIFIGSENKLFSLSGSSVVVAPYRDGDARIIGAVGVIGPTRLNYARIVPMVDYTAQVIGRMLG